MGGYGGASGKDKTKTYFDTGGHKVKDSNAILVAEYYIDKGKYVAFLQETPPRKRADLSIDGVHTEVKGMSSLSTNKVANNIKEAFEQVESDNYRYSPETHRDGQVVIFSRYPNVKTAYKTVWGGYRNAKKKGYIKGNVLLMHNGKMYKIGGK